MESVVAQLHVPGYLTSRRITGQGTGWPQSGLQVVTNNKLSVPAGRSARISLLLNCPDKEANIIAKQYFSNSGPQTSQDGLLLFVCSSVTLACFLNVLNFLPLSMHYVALLSKCKDTGYTALK
jgi:hypothetical protein